MERVIRLSEVNLGGREFIIEHYKELMTLAEEDNKEGLIDKLNEMKGQENVSDKFFKKLITTIEAQDCEKNMFYLTNVYLAAKDLKVTPQDYY